MTDNKNKKSGNGIGIGAAIGVALGTAYGVSSGNTSSSIAMGLALGVAFGAIFDFVKKVSKICSLPSKQYIHYERVSTRTKRNVITNFESTF